MPTPNITITNAVKCSDEQASKIESYINAGRMLDWSTASKQMINTIARAVNDKLLREAPRAIRTETITTYSGKEMEVGVLNEPKAKTPKANKVPAKGTKIAHALEIYKAMEVDGVRSSRQSIISAMANSMQIEKKAAAGYYQNCKKKMGE